MQARVRSFRYAAAGIGSFFQREHNAWLHFMATVAVITLASLAHISRSELLALVFAIGLVWIAEIFNTCIERVMDFVSSQHHPQVRFIKDLAAGGVLVAASIALVVGAIVFIPKIM